MASTTRTPNKRIAVEYLDFPSRTSKRVAFEAWSFTIIGPYQVRVTNESYGYLKDDHAYVVGVEERDGVVVPAECECPADIHHESDCKHKVALATVAGPTVLNAAVAFEKPAKVTDGSESTTTGAGVLASGGGLRADAKPGEPDECEGCESLSGFPCWPCYRTGKQV